MVENRESITAQLCAFVRAWHSNTARQKVFDDYLAYDLLGKEAYDGMRDFIVNELAAGEETDSFIGKYFAPIPLSRIHFTESRLAHFAKGERVQYVICGAGADTFSFRNTNPDIEIFEIDHPDTQRYKLERIRRLEWQVPKNVHFVPVDFERERMTGKLLSNGFHPSQRTFFSILGVSYYLTLPVFSETLAQIAELSALGSVLVFDYPQRAEQHVQFPERVATLEAITAQLGEHMQGGYTYNEVSRALYRLGFQIDTFLRPEKVNDAYFRDRADGLQAFENVSLLSAVYTNGLDYE